MKYCKNCKQNVEPKRTIGVGTFILVLITFFWWLLAIPFYSKRCPMCKGTNFGTPPEEPTEKKVSDEEMAKLWENYNAIKTKKGGNNA